MQLISYIHTPLPLKHAHGLLCRMVFQENGAPLDASFELSVLDRIPHTKRNLVTQTLHVFAPPHIRNTFTG